MEEAPENGKESSHSAHANGMNEGKSTGKAVLLQAWSGPEGSRELRLPDFVTMAQWW